MVAEIACWPVTRWQMGRDSAGIYGSGTGDGKRGEARSPRADTVTLPSISLRREREGGRCGGGAPAQGRAE